MLGTRYEVSRLLRQLDRERYLKLAEDGSLVAAGVPGRKRINPRAYGLDGSAGLAAEDREERYFLEKTLVSDCCGAGQQRHCLSRTKPL